MKKEYIATIGFFDGVHCGHRFLIEQVREDAERLNMPSLLITFDKHPREVLCADYVPKLLSTLTEKKTLLQNTGVDEIHILPFTSTLSHLSALDFMKEVLSGQLHVHTLVMGYDHHFGHGGGSFSEYVQWGREAHIDVVLAKELNGAKVSSSVIRHHILQGEIERANECLGYTYFIDGNVVSGHQVGRQIGFPTANLSIAKEKILPACGVYAVKAIVSGTDAYNGMLCIGHRPTLQNGDDLSVETNLFDFEGNLYGQTLRLEIVKKLRDEIHFASLDDLQQQLREDERNSRECLATL